MIKQFFRKYFELVFWLTALIALAITDPSTPGQYSLCPFKLMGINWCPGCGLGHSISWLLHGNIKKSWQAHWIGVPALLIILYRIFELGRAAITHPADASLGDPLSASRIWRVSKFEIPLSTVGEERVDERSKVRVSK